MILPNLFAAENIQIHLPASPIFYIGPIEFTNSMILGGFGIIVMLAVFGYTVQMVKKGRHNRLTGVIQWLFESMYKTVGDIIPDKKMAQSIAPLALTIFFTVLFTYWISILPGVGESVTWHGAPLLRGLPTDLNFTLALAIISMTAAQFYAVKTHGFFGNAGRYFINPFKNPIGTFEGFLEFVGEFSRLIALCLRLFGNAFAGEVLLTIASVMTGYFASLSLPVFMAFELFIGIIQAYVFYILTLIFAALATASHGSSEHSPAHSADITSKEAA
jgi:F-type H+-transporting ATPase subunit a